MTTEHTVDEGLYSRQLYAIGGDAMKNLTASSVYIDGMTPVGIEIAKCIALTGVKHIHLNDSRETITNSDLSGNYYASNSENISNSPVDIAYKNISELNPYVQITKSDSLQITTEVMKNFDIIVVCNKSMIESIGINEICRENNVKFIHAQTIGLMGVIFCDFGDNHIVSDINGDQLKSGHIVLFNDNLCTTNTYHNLLKDDIIEITNTNSTIKVKVKNIDSSTSFTIEQNISNLQNGVQTNTTFTEIKQPFTFHFKPMIESIENPEFVISDMADFDRPLLLHKFIMALEMFKTFHNRLPKPWNDDDANYVVNIVETLMKNNKFNKEIVKKLCYSSMGDLCPMASVIGSIAAQEVIKAVSKKYTPIKQWFYFDALTILPDNKPTNYYTDEKSRYYSQELIFGHEFQEQLKNSNVFIVGSGAIGCEHLKNFSMMGVGKIIITDMDTIEKSNLNRQFLFRNTDIGKFKSETAANAVKRMNPLVDVIPQLNKVGNETMHIYNNTFFEGLTCVANALDNVQARLFMDNLCLMYKKPLLESGTLGAKGNCQSIIPYLTKTYGMTQDPPETSIPVCTLKNFPYLPEHVIHWARDIFEGIFNKIPNNFIKLHNTNLDNLTPTELNDMFSDVSYILSNKPRDYKDCVIYGFNKWYELYVDNITSLIEKFPANHTNDDGTPFWSGTKQCPSVAKFNGDDMTHVGFVHTFARLWANVFGITNGHKYSINAIQQFVKQLKPPKRTIKQVSIAANEQEEKKNQEEINNNIDSDEILEKLKQIKLNTNFNVTPIEFEKDDDTNNHIDFITNTANMRAQNYNIPQTDRFKTKGIAGKIIPALATTTSLVSGLISLELYKVIQGFTNIERFRDAFINMSKCFITFTEPQKIVKNKIGKLTMSLWDSVSLHDPTISELIDYFNSNNIEILSVSIGDKMLFSSYLPMAKKQDRLKKKISTIYKEIINDNISYPIKALIVPDVDDDEIDPIQCNILQNQ